MTPPNEHAEKALQIRFKLVAEFGDEVFIGRGYAAGVELEKLITQALHEAAEAARREEREYIFSIWKHCVKASLNGEDCCINFEKALSIREGKEPGK